MLLKDLLNFIIGTDPYEGYKAKIDLWDANDYHKDILVDAPMDDIPEMYLNLEVERIQGLIAKDKNHFIISIHLK
jgi:hypothetical protein